MCHKRLPPTRNLSLSRKNLSCRVPASHRCLTFPTCRRRRHRPRSARRAEPSRPRGCPCKREGRREIPRRGRLLSNTFKTGAWRNASVFLCLKIFLVPNAIDFLNRKIFGAPSTEAAFSLPKLLYFPKTTRKVIFFLSQIFKLK